MCALVQEFEHGCPAVIAHAADEVGDVVAVKPAGGGQHDEVVSTLDQVGRLDRLGLR